MLSLDNLVRSVPAHQAAGHFSVDIFGFLKPQGTAAGGEGVRLCPFAGLERPLDLTALFRTSAPLRLSREDLDRHVLVVRPRGEFFTTDELAVVQVSRNAGDWSVELE